MREDAWPLLGAAAALAALLTITWRATPDRHDITVVLYIAAGVLEASGVALTALDIRAKRRTAQEYVERRPLPTSTLRPMSVRETVAEQSAAARGAVSWGQLERIGGPLLAALDGRILAAAAVLLLLGIGVGTAANVLAATA